MIELALRHAFADIELDIAFRSDARTLALFGDSGAGKTSVLNAIAGLLSPREGRIAIDGDTLFERTAASTCRSRRGASATCSRTGACSRTSTCAATSPTACPRVAVAPVDFDAIVDLLGLGALLERRPDTLSGGERQRVAVGRALLSNPRALLLDEPLTGLHAQARSQVLEHLGRLKRELRVFTVLVTHHADEVAALADEVVHLDAGRVTAQMPIAAFTTAFMRRA